MEDEACCPLRLFGANGDLRRGRPCFDEVEQHGRAPVRSDSVREQQPCGEVTIFHHRRARDAIDAELHPREQVGGEGVVDLPCGASTCEQLARV